MKHGTIELHVDYFLLTSHSETNWLKHGYRSLMYLKNLGTPMVLDSK